MIVPLEKLVAKFVHYRYM